MSTSSCQSYPHVGLAVDPIHVGTGGSRLGRVENTIVRDPVTRIPKIPGSSLAGVMRSYVAMKEGKYPDCAGQGQARRDGSGGHCGQPDCKVCIAFGFARGNSGGFAGLAAFSDMQVLLFPVPSRYGPVWVTAPDALRLVDSLRDSKLPGLVKDGVAYHNVTEGRTDPINLGWLMLPVEALLEDGSSLSDTLTGLGVPDFITKDRIVVISDKLFGHVVNSNLEIRTSVAINPATGAAEEQALFTYEALPRGTILYWEVTCRNPGHFRIGGQPPSAVNDTGSVHDVVAEAHPLLEHLGIGGMGTRGMGRLRVLHAGSPHGSSEKREVDTVRGVQ